MDYNQKKYSNDDITVFWKPNKCIHATYCYRDLIEVFNPRKRPWINMKGASTERIIEVVNKCPTEALTYKWNNENKEKEVINNKNSNKTNEPGLNPETELKPVIIQVMCDGPLVVQGSFSILDLNGNRLKSMTMTSLCRCGATNNSPFCDGSHRKIGFISDDK